MNIFAHAGHSHTPGVPHTTAEGITGLIVIGATVLTFAIICVVLLWKQSEKKQS